MAIRQTKRRERDDRSVSGAIAQLQKLKVTTQRPSPELIPASLNRMSLT